MKNEMNLEIMSVSENESFARVAVGAFISQLDPTMEELTEIKTAVSEAVTNSIIHGYQNQPNHKIFIRCVLFENEIELTIADNGVGIKDIHEAKQPLYTSKPELERSGMGFTIIENFMDSMDVTSSQDEGTIIHMMKVLSSKKSKVAYD